jgi:hypothetical protein
MGTSASVRLATNTVCTWFSPEMARSTMDLSGMGRPPRRPSLAVTTTLAPQSTMRSRRLSALKPANTTLCTAPMRAQASMV